MMNVNFVPVYILGVSEEDRMRAISWTEENGLPFKYAEGKWKGQHEMALIIKETPIHARKVTDFMMEFKQDAALFLTQERLAYLYERVPFIGSLEFQYTPLNKRLKCFGRVPYVNLANIDSYTKVGPFVYGLE